MVSLAERRIDLESHRASRYRLVPADDSNDARSSAPLRHDQIPAHGEDLPYRVELWNPAKTGVEQVLAVTASGSIGYAAFYAATREMPDRYITLRHKNSIVSQWNGPGH
jgi:hypothetical protein